MSSYGTALTGEESTSLLAGGGGGFGGGGGDPSSLGEPSLHQSKFQDELVRVRQLIKSPMELTGKWKPHQVARLFWSSLVVLMVLVGMPVLVLHLAAIESEIRVYLLVISTLFCLLAIPISLYSVRRHLLHFW